MGKLENRTSRMVYHKLIARIQTFRNHPRYAFMFENANIGGDTMAEILGTSVPAAARRQADDHHAARRFPGRSGRLGGVGALPHGVRFRTVERRRRAACCSSARKRIATRLPTSNVGFGPTRRALSRIAKEGRKYGVFLGLVTQRPAEIDPTIVSQCSTLFVMRLSNDRDQALIRSAVSDAAANLLSFIPSLGTREVFTFGAGVALPTRMRFKELPAELRPNSEATGNTRSDAGTHISRDLLSSVIDRWRSASMSYRSGEDEFADYNSPIESAPLQPAMPAPVPPSPRGEALRSSLLKKPLEAGSFGSPQAGKPGLPPAPTRFR